MSNTKSSAAGSRLVHQKNASIDRIVNIIKYVLIGAGSLVSASFFVLVGMPEIGEGGAGEVLFIATYILVALAVLLVVIFYLYGLVENPKGVKYLLIGLVATALLVFASYQMSNSEVLNLNPVLRAATTDGAIRWTEAGLYVTYVLGAAAILSVVLAGVRNLFR